VPEAHLPQRHIRARGALAQRHTRARGIYPYKNKNNDINKTKKTIILCFAISFPAPPPHTKTDFIYKNQCVLNFKLNIFIYLKVHQH
jgi:hypothetical protein